MVEAGVTTFAIPFGQDEAKCQQTGRTTHYLDRNGDIVYSESEGGIDIVDNDICCSTYDPSEASTFTLKEACEVRTDPVPGSSQTTFSQSTGKCIQSTSTVTYIDLDNDNAFSFAFDDFLSIGSVMEELGEDECCIVFADDPRY